MPDPTVGFPQNYGDVAEATARIKWNQSVAATNAANFTANVKVPIELPNGTTGYIAVDLEDY